MAAAGRDWKYQPAAGIAAAKLALRTAWGWRSSVSSAPALLRGPALPAALLLTILAVAVPLLPMVLPKGGFAPESLPQLVAPIPPPVASTTVPLIDRLQETMRTQPATPGGPPVDLNEQLRQATDGDAAFLPVTADDGLTSFEHYARPATLSDGPVISVVVAGLGLHAGLSEKSAELPGEIGLAYSPYSGHGEIWQRHARWSGHEALQVVPVHASDFPLSDAGPLALHPDLPSPELIKRLYSTLAAGSGYFAALIESGAFVEQPDRFQPIAQELADRGIGLIELGGEAFSASAAQADLPYLSVDGPLDRDLAPISIDAALGALEAQAIVEGKASGYLRAYPVSLDRLWRWAGELQNKGITLVPISQLARPVR